MSALDLFERLANSQAITSTAVLTDTYKLPIAGADIFVGRGTLGIRFNIVVAADVATGDETYEFQLVSATASNGTSGQIILASTTVISNARSAVELSAGRKIDMAFPMGVIAATATHITGRLVLAGTTPAITISAWLVDLSQEDNWRPYPAAIASI